ncbi:MAG: septum formation initiator family protein, partial [Candidatus Staskawiczbacteria bacterium]|nr:septum formation initiator family protein [Candidatus Staskawiczbacteria bacterium]
MISNFKKKQNSNTPASFFSSPFVKIFILIVIVFLIFANIKVYKDKKKFDFQINTLKEKIQSIQKKNDILEQGIARADDKDYIEKIAREELDLQMKDEKVISFVMPKEKQKEETNANN